MHRLNFIYPRPCLTTWLIMALALVLSSGCLPSRQPPLEIDYYTLDYSAPPAIAGQSSPLPVIIMVQRFAISPPYNTEKIVYQEKSHSRKTYTYHRWRANPADLATYYLSRDLQSPGHYAAVLTAPKLLTATHVVEGIVDEFYEQDDNKDWYAVLSLTITLLKNHEPDVSKQVLFQKSFTTKIKCREHQPTAVAEAMSKAMAELTNEIDASIYQALK